MKKEARVQHKQNHQPLEGLFISISVSQHKHVVKRSFSDGTYSCSLYRSLLLLYIHEIKGPFIKVQPYIHIHLRFRIKQSH